jgi:hypothetical protein
MTHGPLSPARVVCAAIRRKDTGDVIIGARHYDRAMLDAIAARNEAMQWRSAEQGFIDQHCRFLTREEAWKIADANGQIFRDRDWITGSLHSEHLY